MSDFRSETGPVLPNRSQLYMQAREAKELLQIVTEITLPGPRADVPRAIQIMNEVRAKLGPPSPP